MCPIVWGLSFRQGIADGERKQRSYLYDSFVTVQVLGKPFPILNEGKNLQSFFGIAPLPPPQIPSCFWNKPNLFAKASLCSGSSQYAIISQSLIHADLFTSGTNPDQVFLYGTTCLKLKTDSSFWTFKRSFNDGFEPKWMCSYKARKNEEQIAFSFFLYFVHTLIFCILSLFTLLLGCSRTNFGPLLRGQPHSSDISHCVFF